MNESIESVIWENARRWPEKVAVKSGKQCVTYRDLTFRISAAVEVYRSLPGFAKGRVVLLAAGKQAEFLYAYFGAHLAGLVVAPMAEDTNPERFSYICNILNPFAIIGFTNTDSTIQSIPLKSFSLAGEALIDDREFPDPADVADILFTTGTTGTPKGVPLTYRNELAAARHINTYIGNRPDDVELLALPVSHSFGLGRLRCCLVNAQTLILLGSFVNVKRIFRTMEEEHVTGFSMVPASWRFLQKMVGDKLSQFAPQMRYIEMGSAFFSEDEKRHLAALFPATRVTMHYGLTEASRSAFMEFHEDAEALSSVGKASPGVDIQIVDEIGKPLAPGAEGEICIKGPHVMEGYLGREHAESFYGDYFRTGDAGSITPEGYIYLKSRIKELINVGGKKVAPTEVDEQILKIPGIRDCACVGVPDPEGVLGEVVKACVVPEEGDLPVFEEIEAFLRTKLESYKIPVVWQIIDSVPKTQNGKIQRGLLK